MTCGPTAWRAGHAAPGCARTPNSATSAAPEPQVRVQTAKYKQVTVLFADVVRSMDIAAALDVERLREIMTELVERSAAVVHRYGGTVEYNRRRGDGAVRRPSCVGGSRFSSVPGRAGDPGGGEPVGRRGTAPRRRGSAVAGGPEFRSGDRRRNRFGIAGVCRDRRAGRVCPADGIGGAPRRGDAVGVDRAPGRADRDACRTGVGPHQGDRRTGVRAPTAGDRAAGWSGRPLRCDPGRAAMGDGGPRCHRRPCDRWPRRCRECGGTAGHRQEPDGPRDRGAGDSPRGRGVLGLLRVTRQRHSLSGDDSAAAGEHRGCRPRRGSGPRSAAGPISRRRPRGSAAARRSVGHRRRRCAAAPDRSWMRGGAG